MSDGGKRVTAARICGVIGAVLGVVWLRIARDFENPRDTWVYGFIPFMAIFGVAVIIGSFRAVSRNARDSSNQRDE